MAGVGSTPASRTSMPAEARPATVAAARNSPDARGSLPTTATGRWPLKAPTSASTCAAATERSSASSAVMSLFATPRTPSVPKSRATRVLPSRGIAAGGGRRCARTTIPPGEACRARAGSRQALRHEGAGTAGRLSALGCAPPPTAYAGRCTTKAPEQCSGAFGCPAGAARSALAVLGRLAGLLETGLLALGDAGVAGEEAGLLEGGTVQLLVDAVERAGHTEADRAGLAGGATAVHTHEHVVGAVELQQRQGLLDDLLVHLVREVRVERAAVDLPLAGARDDAHAGDGLLASAGGGTGGRDLTGALRLADHGAVGLRGVLGQLGLVGVEDFLVHDVSHVSCRFLRSSRGGLLRNLGDLEGDGLLGRVRVLGTAVDLELGELLAGQRVLREHAADGLLDGLLGALGEQLGVGGRPQAAREARVAVGLLLLELGAGQGNLVGVDDDDEVTGVDVRCELRLVLAPEQDSGLARETAEHDVGRVDDVPRASDLAGLRGVRAQWSLPSLLKWWSSECRWARSASPARP